MTKFECTRCGKCCMVSGAHIRIERKLGERDFYCRDLTTNNLVITHIESPYLPMFRTRDESGRDPSRCHFLVQTPEGYSCAVYTTRPLSCRNFICYRMRIFSPVNRLVGTIKGRRTLDTTDGELLALWEDRVRPLQTGDDREWDTQVGEILKQEGYRVELFQ